jgi:peroxiredoxin
MRKTTIVLAVATFALTLPMLRAAENEAPKPEDVVKQMADYLGKLPAFSCAVEFTIHFRAQGRENNSTTSMDIRLERPNRLAIVVTNGEMGMTVISDGKNVTQHMPALNRYVVSEAPGTLAELSHAEGITLGMGAGLLPIDGDELYKTLTAGVTGSEYLGTEKIGDVECHHVRFTQESFNWELWVEVGDRPVPHKVVPDFSGRMANRPGMEDAKLEYIVTLTNWNVAPKFADNDFKFEPPAGAEQVDSLFEGMEREEGPHPLLGQDAPAFETTDVEGKPIDLKSLLGKNVIMLDFWATWCGPCVQAMPEVDGVAKKFADKRLVFYGVNEGEDAETIKEFLKSSELEVPVALDQDQKIGEMYHVSGIPQTVLIGKDGKVQVVHIGFSDGFGATLTKEVEALLEGKDLAKEALAKAEEAKKKRTVTVKKVETVGVTPAWSAPGQWTGVAGQANGKLVYATSADKGIAGVNEAGEIKQEIAATNSGVLRLANLAGDAAPEFLVYQLWSSGLKAFGADGKELWQYPAGDGIDDVCAADINGDGLDEVIIGYNGGTGLHVVNPAGKELWKFNEIGNVWHVTAGKFDDDDNVDIVTTSAQGVVHVFDSAGKKVKDIEVPVYGHMVRVAALGDGSRLAIVTGSGEEGETLVGVNSAGEVKLTVALSAGGASHVADMVIASGMPWAAVAMRDGLVNVVDLESAQVVARVTGQGKTPQVAWLSRSDKTPLLVVATGKELNAFEVTPTDVNAKANAENADAPPDQESADAGTSGQPEK